MKAVRGEKRVLQGQILLSRYLMKDLNNLDDTYRNIHWSSTDEPIRFWRSKVKVTAGFRDSEGIHIDARALTSHLLVSSD